ncbi:MAG: ABC transporter permease [Atribacterota bacterium]|nr:ABC transporter permease [Atribacterota bacterium]
MKRLLFMIKTEILATGSSLPFHIIALLSPILFFLVFAGQLDKDISFPISFNTTDTPFYQSIDHYRSPVGTPYYDEQDNNHNSIFLTETEPLKVINNKLSGSINQKIESIDKNITKNYRNRLTGALSNFFYTQFPERAIQISETSLYGKDPSWASFFAASILIFGILLSGLLFGTLSFTREWELNCIDLFKLSPMNPIYILSGKFLGSFVKSIITVILYILFVTLKLKILIFNSLDIIGIIFLAYFTAIIIGMLIGIVLKQSLVAFITSLISSILLWVLGGGFGTSVGMAKGIQMMININPISKYMKLVLHSCFNGPTSLIDIIYPIIILIISVFFLYLKYYKEIYKPQFTSVKY